MLEIFGWLNHYEEMPRTEQLSGHHGLSLRWLPRLAARRVPRAKSLIGYAAISFHVLIVVAWVSWMVVVGASAHSASCLAAASVVAAKPDTHIVACGLIPSPVSGSSRKCSSGRISELLSD
jgi:hypothetical protein